MVHKVIRTSNFTAFAFNISTIVKIAQNEFSYYHIAVSIQFIVLLTVSFFGCALFNPGWGHFRPLGRITSIINLVVLAGEAIYLQITKPHAEKLDRVYLDSLSSTQSIARFYERQGFINCLFILGLNLGTFPFFALSRRSQCFSYRLRKLISAAWMVGIGIYAFSFRVTH